MNFQIASESTRFYNRIGLHKAVLAALLLAGTTTACQSASNYSDKSAEIESLETQKKELVASQEAILAPTEFSDFEKSLAKAKILNSEQKDSSNEVGRAKILAEVISEKSKPSKVVLKSTLIARQKALEAGAASTDTFKKIDEDLTSATQQAASGNISKAQKQESEYTNRYLNVEGDVIVGKAIGAQQSRLAKLKESKVNTIAPQTLLRSEAKLEAAERSIRADRYNPQTLENGQQLATFEVNRLVRVSTDAQRLKSESAAVELFEKDQKAASLEGEKQRLQTQLNETKDDQSSTAAELQVTKTELNAVNDDVARKQKMDQRYADAKKLFLEGEAQVFQDGENLLIRLKGVNFVSGKGTLPAQSQALLKKLGTVIADFGSPMVRIEGHTDSTGTAKANARISTERATIVKDYLVSKNILKSEDIATQGLGDSGPLASNKTPKGREQNRRVDVIVQPRM